MSDEAKGGIFLGIFFAALVCLLTFTATKWYDETDAVKHHAAQWLVATDGDTTFQWLYPEDKQ